MTINIKCNLIKNDFIISILINPDNLCKILNKYFFIIKVKKYQKIQVNKIY